MDYFSPEMTDEEINRISNLGLAHMGDAVYELLVRTWLCCHGGVTSKNLHELTVSYVRAPAQAEAAGKIRGGLTEEEQAVYRRGRNTKVNSVPHNATPEEYHAATGLETLFGWLYLKGEKERINEIFEKIMPETPENDG